jgi:hypothetical protein
VVPLLHASPSRAAGKRAVPCQELLPFIERNPTRDGSCHIGGCGVSPGELAGYTGARDDNPIDDVLADGRFRKGTPLVLVLPLEENPFSAHGTFPRVVPEVGIDVPFQEALSPQPPHVVSAASTFQIGFFPYVSRRRLQRHTHL